MRLVRWRSWREEQIEMAARMELVEGCWKAGGRRINGGGESGDEGKWKRRSRVAGDYVIV